MKIRLICFAFLVFAITSCNNDPLLHFDASTFNLSIDNDYIIDSVFVTNGNGIRGINDVFEYTCPIGSIPKSEIYLSDTSNKYELRSSKLDSVYKNDNLYFNVFVSKKKKSKRIFYKFSTTTRIDTIYVVEPFRPPFP